MFCDLGPSCLCFVGIEAKDQEENKYMRKDQECK